jgi:hypothetical protein
LLNKKSNPRGVGMNDYIKYRVEIRLNDKNEKPIGAKVLGITKNLIDTLPTKDRHKHLAKLMEKEFYHILAVEENLNARRP